MASLARNLRIRSAGVALRSSSTLRVMPVRFMSGDGHGAGSTTLDEATAHKPNNNDTYYKTPVGDSLWRGLVLGLGAYFVVSYTMGQGKVGFEKPAPKPEVVKKPAADAHAAPAPAAADAHAAPAKPAAAH